jgi:outer membrane protein assembly factor BamB
MTSPPSRLAPLTAVLSALAALALPVRDHRAADWPSWRGHGGTGVSPESDLPVRWSASENLLFKVDLPGRGLSSPVIAGGRAYVTASSGVKQDRLHVLSFDARTGKRVWERQLWATGNTQCHPKTCMAAPTPVLDGGRIYALFATFDLVAFDGAGTIVWYRSLARDYPDLSNQVGMASSPVVWEDLVILDLETDSESFALAIDKRTGVNRWKTPRKEGINWTTPVIARRGAAVEILLQSRHDLSAYDPRTGARLWTHAGGNLDTIASPVAVEGAVYVPAGELLAVEPGGPDEDPRVLWKSPRLRAATASPLHYEGRVYAVNSAGVLGCADGKTGEILWQERLEGAFSASPVAGDGKVYCVNEEGVTAVVDVRAERHIAATNPIGATILASPAIAAGAIYLRSDNHLYAIADPALEGGRAGARGGE